MSIHTQRQTLNGGRIAQRTMSTVDNHIARAHDEASDIPQVAYDDQWWADLQRDIEAYVDTQRMMLASGGYTDAAKQLRRVVNYGVRDAVEHAKAELRGDPYIIQTAAFWTEFRERIHSHVEPTDA